MDFLDMETAESKPPTMIFCMHQTLADLICHLLVEGADDEWAYGDIKYRMENASIMEILMYPDGDARLGVRNAVSHLW